MTRNKGCNVPPRFRQLGVMIIGILVRNLWHFSREWRSHIRRRGRLQNMSYYAMWGKHTFCVTLSLCLCLSSLGRLRVDANCCETIRPPGPLERKYMQKEPRAVSKGHRSRITTSTHLSSPSTNTTSLWMYL
jgi:hypothetical protein